jgi:hypothetical protein
MTTVGQDVDQTPGHDRADLWSSQIGQPDVEDLPKSMEEDRIND